MGSRGQIPRFSLPVILDVPKISETSPVTCVKGHFGGLLTFQAPVPKDLVRFSPVCLTLGALIWNKSRDEKDLCHIRVPISGSRVLLFSSDRMLSKASKLLNTAYGPCFQDITSLRL